MTSALPGAIDYLVANLGTLKPGLQVIDGPPVDSLEPLGLAIGYDPEQTSAEVDQSGAGMSGEQEDIRIRGIAWARSGDTDIKTLRLQVFDLMSTLEESLQTTHRKLGGAVTNARLSLADYDQLQTKDGAWATVAFTIICKAFK